MARWRSRVGKMLTPSEWARFGAMAGVIIVLHVLGWGMLAIAVSKHYHVTSTEIFGLADVEGNGHQPPDLVELAVVPASTSAC